VPVHSLFAPGWLLGKSLLFLLQFFCLALSGSVLAANVFLSLSRGMEIVDA